MRFRPPTSTGSRSSYAFNADGDGTPQKIRFAFPLSKVEQTDLNGNATAACAIRKRGGVSEIEVAMPRFGLKTLRLTK